MFDRLREDIAVVFEREDNKIKRAIFILGDKQLSAMRIE